MIATRLRVHSIGAHLATRLGMAASLPGRPHSVFTHAINFTARDGTLVTLHGPGPLTAPFAVALHAWDDALAVGDLALDLDGAARVDLTVRPAGDRSAVATLEEALARSDGRPLAAGLGSARGREARAAMGVAIQRREAGALLDAARALIGLGEGLTPAGDDYLVGSLAVLHRLAAGWPVVGAPAGEVLIAHACRSTPSVSAAFLCHAVAGRFSQPLRDLLMADTAAAARPPAVALASMGATSGADTLTGMRETLAALTTVRA
jgi:hypothetical protein